MKKVGRKTQTEAKKGEHTSEKLISLLMTIAVLLSVLQPAWAIEEAAEIDAVAASRNLIVVVPGIIKRVGK